MKNYALNEEKMFADITDDVAIIINSETGIYYGLNILGTKVFELIIEGASDEDIIDAFKNIESCPKDIEHRLKSFITNMLRLEILTEKYTERKKVNIDKNIAINDSFDMNISEYNDAQELLLADPIHEVKEETGWTPEKDSIGYSKEETIEREKKMETQEA